jgi:N-acetylglutamate synthase-like GNAT family acetyltransferase
MGDMTTRRARADDVVRIETLVHEAFGKYVTRIGQPPVPMLADYATVVATHRVWVVEADDTIVGVVVNQAHDDHLLLDTVAVAPDTQGRGVGALLLRRAEDDARELSLPEVRLYTHRLMTENQTFYPRYGYVETARGMQDGYDRVFYVKPIALQ